MIYTGHIPSQILIEFSSALVEPLLSGSDHGQKAEFGYLHQWDGLSIELESLHHHF
tara:strand:+ start:487 stop:654 length:168 start_codon:yes stop_codon:yes gene_type:complete